MQYDDERPKSDAANQDDFLDPLRGSAGDRVNDATDDRANRLPGAQPYAGQAQQAAARGRDAFQQGRGDRGGISDMLGRMGGLGGIGDMISSQDNAPVRQGDTYTDPGASFGQRVGAGGRQITDDPARPSGRRANASDDPNEQYDKVDDVVADYGNRSPEQRQQDSPSW